MGGTYGTQSWWWTEEDKFPLAKFFVEDFEKAYGYKPRWGASEIYLQLMLWADAVTRAGSFYPVDVIKALEAGQGGTPSTARSGIGPATINWCARCRWSSARSRTR